VISLKERSVGSRKLKNRRSWHTVTAKVWSWSAHSVYPQCDYIN